MFVVRVWREQYREELILNVTVFVAKTWGGGVNVSLIFEFHAEKQQKSNINLLGIYIYIHDIYLYTLISSYFEDAECSEMENENTMVQGRPSKCERTQPHTEEA